MRRLLFAALIGAWALGAEAMAQMIRTNDPIVGAKVWPGAEAGIAGYKVFRKGGGTTATKVVVEKVPWYHFTDATGKRTSQYIQSVERIEPILQAEIDQAEEAEEAERATEAVRLRLAEVARQGDEDQKVREVGARVSGEPEAARRPAEPEPASYKSVARSSYRSGGRISTSTSYRTAAPKSDFIDQSQSGIGTTATGIPLNMGPRGGIFHYSKSGKKVYKKK